MSDDEIQNTYLTGKAFQGDKSRVEIKKTLEQKIAGAQNKLNYLKAKEKRDNKKENTRQKIILGAEVAKVLECDISEVDKQLLFGILLEVPSLYTHDIARYKINGQIYIERVLKKFKP
ncbi:conjugal transfer protein TraD [Enterobacter kobei]|uniref:conjugal transfer protein TraD n=1 Tax=Enterobacter kobei TaxID=208224 RepID=UPI001ABDF67C|nr:conjugal transfer protein TraD [Enterobacter kobei]MBO4158344.1 conjugal transfer protein TraD [Enterobacter kobei]MCK7363530.1 conjugal transfer protein TraD [Enterobacter kobei]